MTVMMIFDREGKFDRVERALESDIPEFKSSLCLLSSWMMLNK